MTLTPLRRLRARIEARLGDTYKFWRAVTLAAILLLGAFSMYFLGRNDGYGQGRTSAFVEQFQENDCRAKLAGPVNDAVSDQSVALAVGLVAAVAADDPEVQARLEEITGESDPDVALHEEALRILTASEKLRKANAARGIDPVAKCAERGG